MENITVLDIVFSPSPFEKSVDVYVYDEERFIGKAAGAAGGSLKGRYGAGDKYTWHFLNGVHLEEFLDRELSGYYGKIGLQSLSGYIVRYLNYRHTGIPIRGFAKGMVCIGEDGREYICLEGRAVHDSRWVLADEMKVYRVDSGGGKSFLAPKGTKLCVSGWLGLGTELVNITGRAELQGYVIEGDSVVFL